MEVQIKMNNFEKDVENNFEKQLPIKNQRSEISLLAMVAKSHLGNKKSITIHVQELDL